MKSLKTIQGLSKAGKILSTIAFVCCIIGACSCVIGLLFLIIGGSTAADFIESTGKVNIGTVYASIVIGLILCISEIIVSRSARLYFIHELDAGTPFTFDGANELLMLGIKTIAVPAAAVIVSYIAQEIFQHFFANIAEVNLSNSDSLVTGVAFVVISFILKCSTELAESKKEEENI